MARTRYEECMISELDLFTVPKIQTSVLRTDEIPYKPIASLDRASVLEFLSLGQGDTYRDLSKIYLRLKCKVVKGDGSDYADAATNKYGIVNNMLHSLFQQVTVYLGNKAISVSDNNYAFRAYIEGLLRYNSDDFATHVESTGFFLDTAGELDSLEEKKNTGLDKRKALIIGSSTFELMGRLHCDMLNQHKFLLSNVDLRIVMALQKPEFYMLEALTERSYVKILDATLFIHHMTISPSIMLSHEAVLAKGVNAHFPYTRVETKSYTVAAGTTSLSLDNAVIGTIPRFLLFGMIDNDSYTGTRTKNPFNFKHYDITLFHLTINGVQYPMEALQFDFGEKGSQSMRAYTNLFRAINVHDSGRTNLLTKKLFDTGGFLLAFDLTSNLTAASDCANLLNQGTIRIEGRFAKALPNTITCLVYCEYEALVEIDRFRNVYVT